MRFIILIPLLFNHLLSSEIFKPLTQSVVYDKNIISLGRELFYDPLLSKNKDISCFSCHNNYGVDNKKFSIGTNGKVGFINSPTVFNLHFKLKYFWNGRVDTLKEQLVDGPLFNDHEMANDKQTIEKRIQTSLKYQKLFQKAYQSKPTFELLQDALSQFQQTLITLDSKFDKYLQNKATLSKKEQQGLDLFISYGCVSCHNGVNIGGNSYQKIGSVIPFDDSNEQMWEDRYKITSNLSDKMVFIVPSLRNIEKTAPYFHSGSVQSLKDAIKIMGYHNIGTILQESEIDAIEAFLKTLTGKIPSTFKKELKN